MLREVDGVAETGLNGLRFFGRIQIRDEALGSSQLSCRVFSLVKCLGCFAGASDGRCSAAPRGLNVPRSAL